MRFWSEFRRLPTHPLIVRTRSWFAEHHYSTPLFIARETLASFKQHNGFNIAAALSFYALFALIPMVLLMLFLLSHLVFSSSYAVGKLTMLTAKLMPKFSHRIMIEVYNISKQGAVFGVFGMMALFWAATPLAGAVRSALHTISAVVEERSLLQSALKDALAVLGILLLLCLFTFSGVMLEKLINTIQPIAAFPGAITSLTSLGLSTLLIALFYRAFFPAQVSFRHLLAGSLLTSLLWIAMRPAFGIFLFVNQSYGTIFGGMKNMLISIAWLYYTFAVFLLGTELIATLWKKRIILLKELFVDKPQQHPGYRKKLMQNFGRELRAGEYLFREGQTGHEMYYILSGTVNISRNGVPQRHLQAGDYFGEMALLSGEPYYADAIATAEHSEILSISAANMETLLLEEPKAAMSFLKGIAHRLRQASST